MALLLFIYMSDEGLLGVGMDSPNSIAQAGFKPEVLPLSQYPACWDYSCEPICLADINMAMMLLLCGPILISEDCLGVAGSQCQLH